MRRWLTAVAAGALVVLAALVGAVAVLEVRADRAAGAAAAAADADGFLAAARSVGAALVPVACLRRPGDDAAACYLDALESAAATLAAAGNGGPGELPAVAAHALAAGAVAPTCRFIGPVLPVPSDPYDLPLPPLDAARPLAAAILGLAAELEVSGQPEQANAWTLAALSYGEHLGQSVALPVHAAGLAIQEEAAAMLAELYRERGCASEAEQAAFVAAAVGELHRREQALWERLDDLPRTPEGRAALLRLYTDPATPDALRLELALAAAGGHLATPRGRLAGPTRARRELVAELLRRPTGDPLLDHLVARAAERLDLPLHRRLAGLQHGAVRGRIP